MSSGAFVVDSHDLVDGEEQEVPQQTPTSESGAQEPQAETRPVPASPDDRAAPASDETPAPESGDLTAPVRHGSGAAGSMRNARPKAKATTPRSRTAASPHQRSTVQDRWISERSSRSQGPVVIPSPEAQHDVIQALMQRVEVLEGQQHTVTELRNRVESMDARINEKLNQLDLKFQTLDDAVADNGVELATSVDRIESQCHSMTEHMAKLENIVREIGAKLSTVPQTYDVGTPQPPGIPLGQPPSTEWPNPWSARQEASVRENQPSAQTRASTMPSGNPWSEPPAPMAQPMGPARQTAFVATGDHWARNLHQGPVPEMPQSYFSGVGSFPHPGERAEIRQDGYHSSQPCSVGPSMQAGGKSIHKEISYLINRKNTDDLRRFNGRVQDFEDWAERMVDHLCISTNRYRELVKNIRSSPYPFTCEGLARTQSNIDGFNALEIALELGGFTMKYLSSELYEDRYQLCGGKELNGFELWRNLELRYGGTGKEVEVNGLTRFMSFPQCASERGLLKHVNLWEELLNKYGSELRQTPATLRIMLINTLPKDMADKLRPKRVKYPTFQSIMAYVRNKIEEERELYKADVLHQPKGPSAKIHSFDADAEPEYKTYCEVAQQAQAQAPPAQVPKPAAPVSPTMVDIAQMIAALGPQQRNRFQKPPGGRQGQPNSNRSLFRSFRFKGCFECGSADHSRKECPAWLRILDKEGKPPAGHKGARDKAFATFKDKIKNDKTKIVKSFIDEDLGTEGEDDFEYDGQNNGQFFSFLANNPVPIMNSFQELEDPADVEPVNEVVNTMSTFAHRTQVGRKQPQKKSKQPKEDVDSLLKEFGCSSRASTSAPSTPVTQTVIIRTASDLEKPNVQSIIKALPDDPDELRRLASLCPVDAEPLKKGEKWVLLDTGANTSALKVERDAPQYAHLVKPTIRSRRGDTAQSACGGSITERGGVTIKCLIDDDIHRIPYRDMDVTMPLVSAKQSLDKGDNYLVLNQLGGRLINLTSKKSIRIWQRHGVFFFKATFLPPDKPTDDASSSSPFGRRG